MKKVLLTVCLALLSVTFAWSQCVPTCSNYAVTPITYTVLPIGTSVTPSSYYPNADDGTLTPVPIGFTFNYYCSNYTDVIICTNGFIQLDYGTPPDFSNPYVHPTQTFPSSTAPNNMVALNMVDMDPGTSGAICYTTVGTAPNRMFVVTYSNVPIFGVSNYNFGQIVLHETTNEISIYTGTLYPANSSPGNGTQGIENSSGTLGTTPPGRNNSTTWYSGSANTAYKFSPYTPAPPTAITGPTILCQGAMDTYTATTMIGASSYTWSLPGGWTGTATGNSITANTGASGTISVTATYTCGMSAPTTLSVTISPAPTVAISSIAPNVICSGASVNINVTGSAQTFTREPGSLTGSSPISDAPTANTVYTLTGTDSLGCISVNTATAAVVVKETPTVTVNSGTICQGETFTMTPSGANSYAFSSTFSQVTPVAGTYTYSVTGTATNGCVSDPAISSLTVSPIPVILVTANRTSMCVKETNTISASGGDTYSWSPVSMTGTSITITPTLAIPKSYSVTGYSAEGCAKTATIMILINTCTGIEEAAGDNSFILLYPNPTSGEFSVNSKVDGSMIIYDVTGKQVMTQQIRSGNNNILLTGQPAGKYFVKVTAADRQKTMVLIKE
jgi:hypothetical protein